MAAKKKTTRKPVSKTTKRKVAKKVIHEYGTLGRRETAPMDDTASRLLKCTTVEEMIGVAEKTKGINLKGIAGVEEALKAGIQEGLLRMRLGNLIRGAVNRASRGDILTPSGNISKAGKGTGTAAKAKPKAKVARKKVTKKAGAVAGKKRVVRRKVAAA